MRPISWQYTNYGSRFMQQIPIRNVKNTTLFRFGAIPLYRKILCLSYHRYDTQTYETSKLFLLNREGRRPEGLPFI